MLSKERVLRWVFYLGILTIPSALLNGVFRNPGGVLLVAFLMAPYLIHKSNYGENDDKKMSTE